MQMLAIDLLKSGQLPLWNPYILAGTPLLANFQSSPFSPTNFVYFVFDRLTAWSIQIMLQHFLAALFTYVLLRYWKVQKLPSLLGGIIFAFSGFNTIWSQWNGHALSAALIPLLLLFGDRWLARGKWFDGVGFSVAIAFQIYSGYPQVVFYTVVALDLLWLFRFQKSKKFFTRTIMLGLFGFLGLGLAAPQILPGRELLFISQREIEEYPYEWAFLPFIKIITFFAPDYFGNHATQNYWGPQDYMSNTGFVGVVASALAMIAVLVTRKDNTHKFLILLFVVSLILAFPTPISIFFWKSGLFGLQAASAHRALVLFNLSIALLAGFGAETFLARKNMPILRAFVLPCLVLVTFGLLTAWLYRFGGGPTIDDNIFAQGKDEYRTGLRNLILPTAVLAVSLAALWWSARSNRLKSLAIATVFLLMVVELYRFWWKFTPFSPRHIVFPTTPVLEFLQTQRRPFRTTGSRVIPVNMRMPYQIETVEGYDAVYPLHMSQFIAAATSGKSGTQPVGRYGTLGDETARSLSLVNTRYILTLKKNERNQPSPDGKIPSSFDSDQFPAIFEDGSVVVLESKNALPRAFMVYKWEQFTGRKTLDKFMAQDFPIDKKILIEENIQLPQSTGEKLTSEVSYIKYSEQESILKVNTPTPGLLFISDTYYPGWKAYVDGIEEKIYKANFAFRAIPLSAGEHYIKVNYKPDTVFNGLKISGLSFSILLLAWTTKTILGKKYDKSYT